MNANRKHPLVAGALVGALACLLAGSTAAPAAAQCSYTALTDKSPVTVSNSPAFFTINQPSNFWTAVAVMSPSGTDWDISLWQDTYTYPGCVTNILAGSSYGGSVTDFVVADYNHNPFGTRYVEVNRYAGSGNAELEWNASNGVLPLNGPYVTLPFGTGVYVYDVWLEAGVEYGFTIDCTGSADLHMYLFRNATTGACWKARIDAEFDINQGTVYYAAPATDYYGLVVVNHNGLSGDAHIRVSACSAPIALTSGTTVSSVLAENYYSITQVEPYWTAVGLRGSQYWNLEAYRSRPATPGGPCLADGLAATSGGSTTVGVVVGDFSWNAPGTYYLESKFPFDWPSGTGSVQWDSGADRLWVNGMFTQGTMNGTDIVRVWDVLLEAGTSYHFTFSCSGADLKLLLFGNPWATEFWGHRGDQLFTATGDRDFTPASTGFYGVVLVNDNGATGTYRLRVGTCASATAMVPGDVIQTVLAENHVQFTMSLPYWSGIGVRGSDPGTDWDMAVQGPSTAPFPVCHAPTLGTSILGPGVVDFVVGDFNHTSLGPHHARPYAATGEGTGTGTIVFPGTEGVLGINDQSISHATGPQDFLQVWDVYLTGGLVYDFVIAHMGTGARLLLFRNTADGEYWTPRGMAEFELTGPDNGAWYSYVAPASDWYGVAVVNDAGVAGTYYLRVEGCTPRTPLASGVPVSSTKAQDFWSLEQSAPYWTAVGMRAQLPWDVLVTSGMGNQVPLCASDLLVSSHLVPWPGVNVVAGDFNANPYGTYGVTGNQRYDTTQPGTIEWDSGTDQIILGAVPMSRTTGPDDVLEAWDCLLQGGTNYTFEFVPSGAAQLKLLIFRNPTGGTYWATRADAELELPASATWRATGTSPAYFGLVVVNENGQPGSYTLRVYESGPAAVDEGPPAVTALTGVRPNPAPGGVSIAFGLSEAAEVSFQVHDPTGRLVAAVPARRFDAGRRTVAWDGRGAGGARLPAGLYFVRMSAGGRVIGTARVTLLE